MKHKLLGNKYGSRCITWCPTQLQISSPIAHQPTFHSARFTCEYARSFNHFPIKLANLIARQLITGTVIPFHIHNVVAQLHQNGELRSAELFAFFWWAKFFRMFLQFSAKNQSSFLYFRWTFLCQPSGLFFDIQNFVIQNPRNFQPKQRPNAVKHRIRHRGM